MKFKEFLINENLAYLAEEIGVLLASLQSYQEELNALQKLPKKRLNNVCDSSFGKIKSILESGNIPRNKHKEIEKLQKIAFTFSEIKKNKLDYKEFFPKIVSNLEAVVTGLGLPINNIASTDVAPINDKDSLESQEKSDVSRSANDKAPTASKNVASVTNPTAPNVQADQLYAQPLGGSSGPLSAF